MSIPPASLPPAHPARKSSAIAGLAVLPPRPSPSPALCGAGRRREPPGWLGWGSVWPPPPGVEPQSNLGRGAAAATQPTTPHRAQGPPRPAPDPSKQSSRSQWSLTSGLAPRLSGLPAVRGRGAGCSQWGEGARKTPRGLRAAAAPHWLGMPGRGGARGTRRVDGRGRCRGPADKECASCARPRAASGRGNFGYAQKGDLGAGPGAHTLAAVREARELLVCRLGGAWSALAPDWAQEAGTWVLIPTLPPNISVLDCIMGTLPWKRTRRARTLQACRLGHN